MADEPFDKFSDPYRPPVVPCEVFCKHCCQTFESWQIEWREMPDTPIGGAWCCPTKGCSGVGFGMDMVPADGAWGEEDDADVFHDSFEDDEDDDDFEDDDDDDEPFFDAADVDVFDSNAFWLDDRALRPKSVGDTPQAPFNVTPPPKTFNGPDEFDDDDIPF